MEYTYQNAFRRGERCYKEKAARDEDPYLPVLEKLVPGMSGLAREALGLQEVPLEQIVGTVSEGRRQNFAADFMPLMEESTEFAAKYKALITAHETEGIREPLKLVEYLHRFYVAEGNKRVSVLKLFEAVSVPAEVTRLIPAYTDEPAVRAYYEFMRFSRIVPAGFLHFSRPGDYARFLTLTGWSAERRPGETDLRQLRSVWSRFQTAYRALGGSRLRERTDSDAFLIWLEIYGWEKACQASPEEIRRSLGQIWGEFELPTDEKAVKLVTDASEENRQRLLEKLFVPEKVLKIAFLYEKTPETLSWTYGHELGRRHVQAHFGDRIVTRVYDGVDDGNIEDKIRQAAEDGADVLFVTSSRFLNACLKAAVTRPEVRILCCALYYPHRYLRTYYARMYEAKFVSGAIAGALTESGKIGYVANCPFLGNILNLNAFANGVRMTAPHARVHVVWTDEIGADPRVTFWDEGISLISGRELLAPVEEYHREFGLYRFTPQHEPENLAVTLWNWGVVYRRLIESIRSGAWDEMEKKSSHKALNYFWGFDSGATDLLISENVPEGTAFLARHLADAVKSGAISPFYGITGPAEGEAEPFSRGIRVIKALREKGWLLENIRGHVPETEALRPEVRRLAETQGIRSLTISGT